MSKFEIGDLVKLKSGGVRMTVNNIGHGFYECLWFDDKGSHNSGRFSEGALVLSPHEEKTVPKSDVIEIYPAFLMLRNAASEVLSHINDLPVGYGPSPVLVSARCLAEYWLEQNQDILKALEVRDNAANPANPEATS